MKAGSRRLGRRRHQIAGTFRDFPGELVQENSVREEISVDHPGSGVRTRLFLVHSHSDKAAFGQAGPLRRKVTKRAFTGTSNAASTALGTSG